MHRDRFQVASQSIEAERSVLCSIFLEAPTTIAEKDVFKTYKERMQTIVFSALNEDDFFDERNAQIYKAVKQVIEKNVVPDFITVGELVDKSLMNYLLDLINFLPAPINLKEYVKIVKKHSLQRQADLLVEKRHILRREIENGDDEKIMAEIESILQQEIEVNRQITELTSNLVVKRFTGQNIRRPVLRCNGLFPEGHVCMLAGSAGTGKTYIALTLAALYIFETKRKALIWLSEDLSETEYRISQMLENVKLWREHKDLIVENLRYVEDIPDPILTKEYGTLDVDAKALSKLSKFVHDFDFILLDPLTDFYGQEENNNTAARRFMNTLKKLVFSTNKIILLTHHTNKVEVSNTKLSNFDKIDVYELRRKIRGASAFIDAPRVTLYLLHNIVMKTPSGLQGRYLVNIKSNVSKTGIVRDLNGIPVEWEIPFKYDDTVVSVNSDEETEDADGGVL